MWLFGKLGQRGRGGATRWTTKPKAEQPSVPQGGFLERLEDRRLLAIDVTFAAGLLTFTSDGTVLNNELTITADNDAGTQLSFTSATDTINLIGAAANPQAGVTAVAVNLLAGNDSLTVNGSAGANLIAVTGPALTFGVIPWAFDVENLTVNGQGGIDVISATGVSVTGDLLLNGGGGADVLSATNLTTGSLTVQDPDSDAVALSGTITTLTGNQEYQTNATLIGPTILNGGMQTSHSRARYRRLFTGCQ